MEYDPRAYQPVAVTVDIVALTIRDGRLHVLLVERGEQPYAGAWALPGGFVRPRDDGPVRGETSTRRRPASWPRRPGCGRPRRLGGSTWNSSATLRRARP